MLPRLERLNRYIIPNSYPRLVEYISRRQAPGEDMGRSLSPRVRGNQGQDSVGHGLSSGSIPACAGEPRGCASLWGLIPVYPRVCGGTYAKGNSEPPEQGLSPRVRGNLRQREQLNHRNRVYPRVCGGTAAQRHIHHVHQGLSPRVRGNQYRFLPFADEMQGLSPRVRGNLAEKRFIMSFPTVYPRVCGGTWASACLGCSSIDGVYPRVCGGTRLGPVNQPLLEGLSPRVRGNRQDYLKGLL